MGSGHGMQLGEGSTEFVAGAINDIIRIPYTSEDIRLSKNGDDLYTTILK